MGVVYDASPRSQPLMGRRSVLRLLGVAAVGLAAGCRSGKQRAASATPSASTTPPSGSPNPLPTSAPPATASAAPHSTSSPLSADQLLAARVAVAEQALLAAYDAVVVAHPELAGRLAAFRADHAAHLNGLVPGATPSTTALSSVAPSSAAPARTPASSTPPLSTAPLSSPPASTAILRQLADLERNAAAARVNDVVTTSGSLARLIASIGGCEAAHAALLSVAT
jgi:hypothetical protein